MNHYYCVGHSTFPCKMISCQGLDDSPTEPLVDWLIFLSGIHPICLVNSSTKNMFPSIQKQVKFELCSDHFSSQQSWAGVLNVDPAWLFGTRPSPKYIITTVQQQLWWDLCSEFSQCMWWIHTQKYISKYIKISKIGAIPCQLG